MKDAGKIWGWGVLALGAPSFPNLKRDQSRRRPTSFYSAGGSQRCRSAPLAAVDEREGFLGRRQHLAQKARGWWWWGGVGRATASVPAETDVKAPLDLSSAAPSNERQLNGLIGLNELTIIGIDSNSIQCLSIYWMVLEKASVPLQGRACSFSVVEDTKCRKQTSHSVQYIIHLQRRACGHN